MSDRFWMKITCREQDRATFEKLEFEEDGAEEVKGALTMTTMCGSWHDLELLSALAVPFFGVHEAGEDGAAGCFASYDGHYVHVAALRDYVFAPVVVVAPEGLDSEAISHVNEYYKVLQKARLAIQASIPPGKRWDSADEILKGIDAAEFKEQRAWLTKVISALDRGFLVDSVAPNCINWKSAAEKLMGLQSLCDALADYAHDVLGKDCLFETKEEDDGSEG